MHIDTVAYTTEIISFSFALVVGGISFWRKVDGKQQNIVKTAERLEAHLERIEKQFGPNSGGIREAVNNMSKNVLKIDDKVDKLSEDVAHLSGKFHQHVIEND
jgi:predicted  nucleic acid-binding Zn-ribbon protein